MQAAKGGDGVAYSVKAYDLEYIHFAPATRKEEILQNIAVILSTPKFSVPLDRGLGLAQRFIDKPIQAAQPILISEVLDAIETYEPRVAVQDVTFVLGSTPGALIPVVEVELLDDEN